jgi:hypothetical protein
LRPLLQTMNKQKEEFQLQQRQGLSLVAVVSRLQIGLVAVAVPVICHFVLGGDSGSRPFLPVVFVIRKFDSSSIVSVSVIRHDLFKSCF